MRGDLADCSERRLHHLRCLRQVSLPMRQADEPCFKLRWREVDAMVQAMAEEFPEGSEVAGLCVGEVVHGFLSEEEAEHAAGAVPLIVAARLLEHVEHGGFHDLPEFLQALPASLLLHFTKLRKSRGECERIAAERSCL